MFERVPQVQSLHFVMFLDGFHMKRKGVQRTEAIMKYQEKSVKKTYIYIYIYMFIIYIYIHIYIYRSPSTSV